MPSDDVANAVTSYTFKPSLAGAVRYALYRRSGAVPLS